MGANVPGWMVKILKASADIVASAGDMAAGTELMVMVTAKSMLKGF